MAFIQTFLAWPLSFGAYHYTDASGLDSRLILYAYDKSAMNGWAAIAFQSQSGQHVIQTGSESGQVRHILFPVFRRYNVHE